MKVTIIEGTRTDSAYRALYKIVEEMYLKGEIFVDDERNEESLNKEQQSRPE